ncbi:type II toxin-antitoxin system CcdA family antitoxin [Promethearchaeum syntrophicum]|uniref:Type II toxin-antitoxin system CcdA family antitoxin n=1 Tax=Promethearchaeum syntrophicum TaxID=2594042 RepID=A0AC61ZU12_9ARCH
MSNENKTQTTVYIDTELYEKLKKGPYNVSKLCNSLLEKYLDSSEQLLIVK